MIIKIDSEKIARMIRGGLFPIACAYSRKMRADRGLLRRRGYFVRRRAELLAYFSLLTSGGLINVRCSLTYYRFLS